MEYKITVIYNQKDFIDFMKAYFYQSKPLLAARVVSKIAFITAGGLLIIVGSINIIHFIWGLIVGDSVLPISYISLPIVFVIIGLLLLTRSDHKRLGKLMWKKYDAKGSEIAYHFYEEYFTEYTVTSEHKINYSVIKSIFEDNLRYYLFVNKSMAHIINKAGFTIGDSKQFAAFISEQTGQDIKQIK